MPIRLFRASDRRKKRNHGHSALRMIFEYVSQSDLYERRLFSWVMTLNASPFGTLRLDGASVNVNKPYITSSHYINAVKRFSYKVTCG